MVRKVDLNMDVQNEYETIKKLVETDGNKLSARVKLGCSKRTISRMITGYKEMGKEYFVHGNTGRKPKHTILKDTKDTILALYNTKYSGANFTHFVELMAEHEKIVVSETTARTTLMKENIISPKATKKVKKRVKEMLLEKQKQPGLSEVEKTQIAQTIIDMEFAHPRRPRCAYFGEMIQMDASVHIWFSDVKCQLHAAIDDSTGAILGAYFDPEETLNGYYNIFHQILIGYGIPSMFFTDRRTVFEYKLKKSPKIEDDTFTQFGYACKQLGVEIKTSSVPQAKGRVERLFQTLQSRLPLEMRLAGVTDIQQANEFLNSYIKKFNAQFALPIDHTKSVFEKQPSNSEINLILAVLTDRKIDSGHCIKFNNKYYRTVDSENNLVCHHKGTDALVIKSFDGELYTSINDKTYGMAEVALREAVSKNFDIVNPEPKQKTKYIPPMSHPWRLSSFMNFLKKQAHLQNETA